MAITIVKIFLLVLAAWNAVTFIMMGADKLFAKKDMWRVRESTLIISAFAMGGIGAFLGSRVFRHKTRKTKFVVLLPVAAAVTVAVTAFVLYKLIA